MNRKKKIFVVEGIDGCGKTSICRGLSQKNNWSYIRTPDWIFREQINEIEKINNKPLAYTYFLSSVLYTSFLIENKKNEIIICDRYYPTLTAYHNATNYRPKFINFNKIPLIKPNKIIHIYVDYETIKNRLNKKKDPSIDELNLIKNKKFYNKLVNEYRKEADFEIDATTLSIKEVIEKVEDICKI